MPTASLLVSGTKRAGGGSYLMIGRALPGTVPHGAEWRHFTHSALAGAGSARWKAAVRDSLLAACAMQLPPGPVTVQLAWRCSPARSWIGLWKPTGDAMGPVLGEPDRVHPFNPADDRIVSLRLHRLLDDTLGWAVDVGMWWRTWSGPGALDDQGAAGTNHSDA